MRITKSVSLLLATSLLEPQHHRQIADSGYQVVYAPGLASRPSLIAAHGKTIRAVVTVGALGLSASEMDTLPALEVICTVGAGYENVDLTAARARGITVASGAGTNDDCVADHTVALLLATLRNIPFLDRACRGGAWRDSLDFPPMLTGKSVGILGLGRIGHKVARRLSGFDVALGYHGRHHQECVSYRWFERLHDLAAWCDALVVATPGGASTRHLIDTRVMTALGPQGVLVNVARGSTVDTHALARALSSGRLGAAGLDVYESEPHPPTELIGLDNVVLTPHIAGGSPESMQASVDRLIANLNGHFAGSGVVSPVPTSVA